MLHPKESSWLQKIYISRTAVLLSIKYTPCIIRDNPAGLPLPLLRKCWMSNKEPYVYSLSINLFKQKLAEKDKIEFSNQIYNGTPEHPKEAVD